jgi:chemotaxis protein histidine kinase CheA
VEAVRDDVDRELLPLFMEEAAELYPQIGNTLRAWRERSPDTLLARKLQRTLHTLKGSARMAGAMRVGELVHRMEEQTAASGTQQSPAFWDELQSQFEYIGKMIELLRTDVAVESAAAATEQRTGQRVPFASISKRLYSIVRQTGKELGKKAYLELRGTEVELERNVLEKITAPFEHLLRNAIAHGLEDPQQRESAGKPPIGDIRLSLRRENKEAVFEFMDDGFGLDVDGLRRKAEEMGLLQAGEAVSDGQVMQLIFAPGLSTATEVTTISGRGVGMDVVRSEITALGGRIAVLSKRGEGTCFIIRLPFTHSNVEEKDVSVHSNRQNCEGSSLGLQ